MSKKGKIKEKAVEQLKITKREAVVGKTEIKNNLKKPDKTNKSDKKKIILVVGIIIGLIVLGLLAFYVGMNLLSENVPFNDSIVSDTDINESSFNDSQQMIPSSSIDNQTNDTIPTTTPGGGGPSGGNGDNGGCTPSKTCANYPGQCGTGLSDGCKNVLDCSNNCDINEICNSSGWCELNPCYGITCSDYNETECEINDCLACRWNGTDCIESVYYVSQLDDNCNDSGPGTEAVPWCNISRLDDWGTNYIPIRPIPEGSLVIIKDGNYGPYGESGNSNYYGLISSIDEIKRSEWTTYRADVGASVSFESIDVSGRLSDHTSHYVIFDEINITNGVYVAHTDYVQIKNCDIKTLPAPYSGLYEPYYYTNQPIIRTVNAHNILIENNEIHEGYRGITIQGANWTIKNNHIHYLGEDGMISTSDFTNNLLIENNIFHNIEPRRTTLALEGTLSGSFSEGQAISENNGAQGIVYGYIGGHLHVWQTNDIDFVLGGTVTGPTGTLSGINLVDYSHNDAVHVENLGSNVIRNISFIKNTVYDVRYNQGLSFYGHDLLQDAKVIGNLVYVEPFIKGLVVGGVNGIDIINNTIIGGYVRFECTAAHPYTSIIDNLENNIFSKLNQNDDAGEAHIQVVSHRNNIFETISDLGGPLYPFVLNSSEVFGELPQFDSEYHPLTGQTLTTVNGTSVDPCTMSTGGSYVGAIPCAEAVPPPQPTTFEGWRAVIMKSQLDYENNITPGEGLQYPHSMVRSVSNPNYIYWAHDCSQGWRSRDGGDTWERFLSKGLGTFYAQSIEVDPADENAVFITMDNLWFSSASAYQGLYKSTDSGDNWNLVLPVDYNENNNRMYKHNIAYALDSVSGGQAQIWYAAFADNNLYKSTDSGDNWNALADLSGHTMMYLLYVHPENNDVLYLGSNQGLFTSTDGGLTISSLGNLPAGAVTSIQLNPQNLNEIYAIVLDNGLYKSTDGGNTFSLFRGPNLAVGVFINPAYPEVIYFLKRIDWSVTPRSSVEVSQDSGNTWNEIISNPREGLGRDTGWGSRFRVDDGLGAIIPNPDNKCEAVGYAESYLWKTEDCINFNHSNGLFSGYAWTCRDSVFFDPDDPSNKVGITGADSGLFISENSGQYFERLISPYSILQSYGFGGNSFDLKAGLFYPGDDSISASGGMIWGRGIQGMIRSPDNNGPWEQTYLNGELWNVTNLTSGVYGSLRNYFYNQNTNELFVADVKSGDGGRNFENVTFLSDNNLEIYGMCKSNNNIMYALDWFGQNIYRSDDSGDNWYLYVSKTEYSYGAGYSTSDELVFDVDPVDCNKIYTLYGGGDLANYDGVSWQTLGLLSYIRSLPENQELVALHSNSRYPGIGKVIVDPSNNSVIYATTPHAGVSAVLRSVDSGAIWEDISYNLPRAGYAQAFSISPYSGEIFVGGCSGTWIFPPPYNQNTALYSNSISRPSCDDKLQNGDETGVDTGGVCDTLVPSLNPFTKLWNWIKNLFV